MQRTLLQARALRCTQGIERIGDATAAHARSLGDNLHGKTTLRSRWHGEQPDPQRK
jgi:hypothetical protein